MADLKFSGPTPEERRQIKRDFFLGMGILLAGILVLVLMQFTNVALVGGLVIFAIILGFVLKGWWGAVSNFFE